MSSNNPHHDKRSTIRNVTRDLGEFFERRCEAVGWINPTGDRRQLADLCENQEISGPIKVIKGR